MNPCIFVGWHWQRFLEAGEKLRHRNNLFIFLPERSSLAIAKNIGFAMLRSGLAGQKNLTVGAFVFVLKGLICPLLRASLASYVGDRKTTKTLLSSYLNHNMIPNGRNMREMMTGWVD